jgi:hypothetical protein
MLKKFFENVNRKIKAPLTLVLYRRGREELKDAPLTLPSPAGWRGKKKGERGLKKNLLN